MNKRERMLTVVIALLVGYFVVDRLLVVPLTARFAALDEQVVAARQRYEAARVLVDNAQVLRDRWQAYQQVGLAAEESVVRIRVQQNLTDWSRQAGFDLTTCTASRTIKGERFSEVHFIARGTGSLRSVVQLLASVHTSPFPLRILSCDLVSRDEKLDVLTLGLTVSTICMPEANGSAASVAMTGGGS